jgi:hypothetical protein
MPNLVRASLLLSLAALVGGCVQQESGDLVMVDQHTGVTVSCQFKPDDTLTPIGQVRRAYTCIDELQYYGFRDNDLVNPPTD